MVLCPQQTTRMYTNHTIDQDGHWQQFGTQPILISAPQWANRPCNAPTQFYRVGKKPSVKADLAIYSHAVDVGGQCMSASLTLRHNLDFRSCDIMVSFCKFSPKFALNALKWYTFNSILVSEKNFRVIALMFCP